MQREIEAVAFDLFADAKPDDEIKNFEDDQRHHHVVGDDDADADQLLHDPTGIVFDQAG